MNPYEVGRVRIDTITAGCSCMEPLYLVYHTRNLNSLKVQDSNRQLFNIMLFIFTHQPYPAEKPNLIKLNMKFFDYRSHLIK